MCRSKLKEKSGKACVTEQPLRSSKIPTHDIAFSHCRYHRAVHIGWTQEPNRPCSPRASWWFDGSTEHLSQLSFLKLRVQDPKCGVLWHDDDHADGLVAYDSHYHYQPSLSGLRGDWCLWQGDSWQVKVSSPIPCMLIEAKLDHPFLEFFRSRPKDNQLRNISRRIRLIPGSNAADIPGAPGFQVEHNSVSCKTLEDVVRDGILIQ